jgi:CheY-like chemotaxis protein
VSQTGDKRRILIIDDSEAIHVDFRRVLIPDRSKSQGSLDSLELEIFGTQLTKSAEPEFDVDSALQGKEALALVQQALAEGRPYSLIFLDYQMPPGWSGLETLRQLRKIAPHVPVVFFSAYSNYSWEEITQEFGSSPLLVELRKPFNSLEMRHLALTLSAPRGSSSIP